MQSVLISSMGFDTGKYDPGYTDDGEFGVINQGLSLSFNINKAFVEVYPLFFFLRCFPLFDYLKGGGTKLQRS